MGSIEIDRLGTRLHDLIEREIGIDVEDHETDLLATGLLDSLALLTVITAIEREFACELPLDEFDLDHFRSVDAMAGYLRGLGVSAEAGRAAPER